MKNTTITGKLILVLLLLIFLTTPLYAYTLGKEATLSKNELNNLMSGKIYSLDTANVASANGKLFFMTRDVKSRRIYWFLIDPFTKKAVNSGDTPFEVFTDTNISPDGKSAVAITKYPTAIWQLDTETRKWNKIFENPKSGGLAISPISPVMFTGGNSFISILDMWNDKHVVTDSFVTKFAPPAFNPLKTTSVTSILWIAAEKIIGKSKSELTGNLRVLRFADADNFVFTFEANPVKQIAKNLSISLVLYNANPKKMERVDEGDIIVPIDYQINPDRVLYLYGSLDKTIVKYFTGGKSYKLIDGKVLAGKIMKNGIIGIATVEGKKVTVYLGSTPHKITKVQTFEGIRKVGFLKGGERIVMITPRQVEVYRINQK